MRSHNSRIVRTKRAPARILGVDPSLSSTGFSYRALDGVCTGTIDPGKLTGPWRLFYIRNRMSEILDTARPNIVVYEDYAMGKAVTGGSRAFHMGELGGILKTLFWERGIDVMLVSPTSLKKSITGRGDADSKKRVGSNKTKPEMRAALLRTFGIELYQGDEADACGLMLLGEIRFVSGTVTRETRNALRLDSLDECPIIVGQGNKLKSFAK